MVFKSWLLLSVAGFLLLSCRGPKQPEPGEEKAPAGGGGRASELVQPKNWWDILPRPGYRRLEKVGEFQNWFQVYKLLEGTYAIYEPYQFQEAISYLVLGSERGVVVDTGNGIGNVRQVVSELTELPVSVLLTHEHLDHFGGAHLFDDVAIYNQPEAIERVRKGVPHERAFRVIDTESGYVWKPLPKGVDPDTFSIPGVEPSRLLAEGDVIELGGRRLEVICTPGHSPGSVCFLDADNRILFTGDHFYPGPLYAHGSDVNVDDYVASNDKLAARVGEYDHVLSGHNEPWVASDVIPRVSEAFRAMFKGEGQYAEDGNLRRYHFDGFDIIIRAETVVQKTSP